MRIVVPVAGLVLIAAGLTGCQTSPTELATPAIEWVSQSDGPMESDPWLEAARAADLGLRLAYNSQDFTISQLTQTRFESSVETVYEVFMRTYVEGGATPVVFPGPAVWLPIEIVESEDGLRADVTVCNASEGWIITAEGETSFDLTAGVETTYEMVNDPESGDIKLLNTSGSSRDCDATGASVGRFDPAPLPPASLTESDVRAPLG
jgi:hypothetical protein